MSRGGPYAGTRIGKEMETAISKLNRWQQQTMAEMTKYIPSRSATIKMLFSEDVIEKARAARGIVQPNHHIVGYRMSTPRSGEMTLHVNYDGATCLPILSSKFFPQPDIVKLSEFAAQAEVVYRDFEKVKGLLRWLNTHATLGAIRAYFPSVMKLCPSTFGDMVNPPTAYQEPHGIEDWLQIIRDAGNTVAAAQLLPGDAKARDRDKLWLTFHSIAIPVGNPNKQFTTDDITFHL